MSRKQRYTLRHGFISLMLIGLLSAVIFTSCRNGNKAAPSANAGAHGPASLADNYPGLPLAFCSFIGLTNYSDFTLTNDTDGQVQLSSPVIKAAIPWNQLIVSWDSLAPAGSSIKIEASAIFSDHASAFYNLGIWSPDSAKIKRTSVPGQKDNDGRVDTDTLVLSHLADAVRLRFTFAGGMNGTAPELKFIGLSFANTQVPPAPHASNQRAWGKEIKVPENSQHGYPEENGWCSPASVAMVMASWSLSEIRPDLLHTVPFVADKVYDEAYHGTGNWPFNTAFAGSHPGMRAYVTRLDDLSEVEDWIAAGIPVILSARWDWLSDGRPPDSDGHLIVCLGFTADGDVIVNDPAGHVDHGQSIKRIYKRANVIHAWTKSHNAVYLIYPASATIPTNSLGHWEGTR